MRRLATHLLSHLPTKIPVGMTEFKTWLDSIVELCGPIADEDSLRWVVSNEIMRLNPGRDRIAKQALVRILRKYAANQLAAAVVNELKDKQKAAQEKQKQEETLRNQAEQAAQVPSNAQTQ